MSPQLRYFLDLVWSNRNWTVSKWAQQNLPARGIKIPEAPQRSPKVNIYGLYNRAYQKQTTDELDTGKDDNVLQFLEQLCRLPGRVTIQTREAWHHGVNLADWLTTARQHKDTLHVLGRSFFHFKDPQRHGLHTQQRIYINVKPEVAAVVMDFVVRVLVLAPTLEVVEAKVAGPAVTRRDGIVIYVTNDVERNKALGWIAKYQNGYLGGPRPYFNFGVPSMTRPIDQVNGMRLIGVGVGAEPPDVSFRHGQIKQKSQSFGTFRSELIQSALDRTFRNTKTKEEFFAAVVQNFQQAGLDPDNPELQADREELEDLVNA